MLWLFKFFLAILLNVISGHVFTTPATDYLDTVIMDYECSAPDCEIIWVSGIPAKLEIY